MKEDRRNLIDKLTVDLSLILEQIYALKESEQNDFELMDQGFKDSKVLQVIQRTISDLENSELSIQHTIELLSSSREKS